MSDLEALHAVCVGLARRATGQFVVEDLLADLMQGAMQALGIDEAGVMLRYGNGFRLARASSPAAERAERTQGLLHEGPCAEAGRSAEAVVEADLVARASRWPAFAEQATAGGLSAVAAIPLRARDEVWGILDLYRREAGEFDEGDLVAAQTLADVAVSYVVMAHDRDLAVAAQRDLAHAATHDPLTGLPNRALLYDRLEHALASGRRRGTGVAVVFLDLDGFKAVNDTHGHETGDLLLVEVAHRLTRVLRSGDTLGRLGGDEFVIVCENLPAPESEDDRRSLGPVVSRVRNALSREADVGGVVLAASASLGTAVAVPGRDTADAIMRAADAAMYEAKRAHGRRQVDLTDQRLVGGRG